MTIAALLCMGNHDIGCGYVREGVRTNLDVFNPDQLQEAYHQFLMYAVYPFIYVPQNMIKDLYDRTLGRVMTEYATHITKQFETTPDRFMEIICQKNRHRSKHIRAMRTGLACVHLPYSLIFDKDPEYQLPRQSERVTTRVSRCNLSLGPRRASPSTGEGPSSICRFLWRAPVLDKILVMQRKA